MINWNKYFDHIFILSRCSNFERRENLNKELKRIGLYDYVTYLYQPDSELLNYNSSKLSKKAFRCKYAHYSCIKMSYELGYDNICILEDDMIFLKSIDEIEKQLEIFLENKINSNIYLFDYIQNNTYKHNDQYFLADFYWLDKHGMKYLIYLLETCPNIMNDSIFLPYLNNFVEYSTYMILSKEIIDYINIKKENNILPININISPKRICVQSQILNENNQYLVYKNEIDISLYNI